MVPWSPWRAALAEVLVSKATEPFTFVLTVLDATWMEVFVSGI